MPALLLAAVHGARVEAGVAPGGRRKKNGRRVSGWRFKTSKRVTPRNDRRGGCDIRREAK